MSLPVPTPGLVVNYGFLWSSEAAKGHREGLKDRPCAIIVAARKAPGGKIRVVLAPITHSPPLDETTSLALSSQACKQIGLDGHNQWLRFDELNVFGWPGFDLRPIAGRQGEHAYGKLPATLFEKVREAIISRAKFRAAKPMINRDV